MILFSTGDSNQWSEIHDLKKAKMTDILLRFNCENIKFNQKFRDNFKILFSMRGLY